MWKVCAKAVSVLQMVLIALDQATQTSGYSVWIDGALNDFGKYTVDDADISVRIHKICLWVEGLLDRYAPDKLVIENIQYQNNIATFQKLAQLQGAIIELAQSCHLLCEILAPSEWRSVCNFLKGNEKNRAAQKKIAQEWVFKQFGAKCTQDEADAICIGYAADKVAGNELNWE